MTSRVWCFLVTAQLGAFAAASNAAAVSAAPAAVCANLLTLSTGEAAPLTPEAIREISDGLWMEKVNGRSQFIENLKRVADDMVAAGSVTPAQAETLFATRVLGDFRPIFLKYAIAELKARRFKDPQIIDFIVNFQDAYGAQAQIDFALAVTRRMLVTVNDATSATSPRGLEQFLSVVEAFGVSGRAYSQFLEIWSHVRTAHPQSVIQFILINIKNAGEVINAEARARLEDDGRAAQPAPRGWRAFLFQEPAPPPRKTLHQVAAELLNGLKVPAFLLDVDGLFVDAREVPSVLARMGRSDDGAKLAQFLDRLDLIPPYAWDFLVGNQLANLSHHQLTTLTAQPIFAKLGAETRERITAQLREFDARRELILDVRRALTAAERARRAAVAPEVPADPQKVGAFFSRFDSNLADAQALGSFSGKTASALVLDAFMLARGERGGLTTADFLSIARMVIAKMFVINKYSVARAVTQALIMVSKDFSLREADARELIDALSGYRFTLPSWGRQFSMIDTPEGFGADETSSWGRRADHVRRDAELPDDVRRSLNAFRADLPPAESVASSDEDLLKWIKTYQP